MKMPKINIEEIFDIYRILGIISLTLFPIYYVIIIIFKISSGSDQFKYNPITNIKQLIKVVKTKEIWIQ